MQFWSPTAYVTLQTLVMQAQSTRTGLSVTVWVQQSTSLCGCHHPPHLPFPFIWELSSYKHSAFWSLWPLVKCAIQYDTQIDHVLVKGESPSTLDVQNCLLSLKVEETHICFPWIHTWSALDAPIRYPGRMLRSPWLWFCMKSLKLHPQFWIVML